MRSIVTTRSARATRVRLEYARESSLTYTDVGATLSGISPPGYYFVSAQRTLGTGPEDFAKAREGLLRWQAHRGAGLRVVPDDATVHAGEDVVVLIPLGPLAFAAPCRVVGVIDEPRRFACAYGTLRGHPEAGEELFDVSIGDDGVVTFSIRAFSKPASLLTRLGSPAARFVQARVTERYLSALARYVRAK